MKIEVSMNYKYYEHFNDFWIPIYRHQVQEAKIENDEDTLNIIYKNIDKNWHLQEYKYQIFESLGIRYLKESNIKIDIEQSEIFKKYEGLIYLCLKKHGLLDFKDKYYDVCLIGLTRGMNSYSPEKGFKESTYYYTCIKNELGHQLTIEGMKKRNNGIKDLSLDYVISDDGNKTTTFGDLIVDESTNIEEMVLRNERNEIVRKCISKLKPEYQYVLFQYFGIDCTKKSMREIAEDLNITHQAIKQKIDRAKKFLKIELLKNGIEGVEI